MIACARGRGITPFLTTIVPRATIDTGSMAKASQAIRNWEELIFQHSGSSAGNITNRCDAGYTVLNKGIDHSAYWVSFSFEASKTKHTKYINTATIKGSFDNYANMYINGTKVASTSNPDSYYGRTKTFWNNVPTDSSLTISCYVIDDDNGWDKLNMSAFVSVLFYYK